jgi:hypothetical protein
VNYFGWVNKDLFGNSGVPDKTMRDRHAIDCPAPE